MNRFIVDRVSARNLVGRLPVLGKFAAMKSSKSSSDLEMQNGRNPSRWGRSALVVAIAAVSSFVLVVASWPMGPDRRVVTFPDALDGRDATTLTQWVDAENVTRFRDDLIRRQQPKAHGRVGFVRWRGEVAEYYAEYEAAADDRQPAGEPPVQLAGHVRPSEASRAGDTSASRWQSFWQSESQRASQWLEHYDATHQQRVQTFADSIVVASMPPSWPAATWVWAMIVATTVGWVAWYWCHQQPIRTWEQAFAGMSAEDEAARNLARGAWTPMEFRAEWVTVRQSWGVHARRILASALVVAAVAVVAIRLGT